MDCCNYMPYRHHQPYYGSQYFHENFPTYHGEFYGQPMYNDYYGMSPYYAPQQWQGFIPPGNYYLSNNLLKYICQISLNEAPIS